jgi:TonB family protein
MGFSASQPAPFSLLPQARRPWREFVFSFGTQGLAIAVFVCVPLLHPELLRPPTHDYHVVVGLVPTPAPVNHAPQPLRVLPQKTVLVARLDPPPTALRLPAAQPKPKRAEDAPAPEVSIAPKKLDSLPPTAGPIIPKQLVRTNTFSTGSSAPQTIARAPQQVQTGGFGDPNGVPAKANEGKAVNIAALGSFDMPSGVGSGNGTGGANGVKGVVASSGFGNGVATGDGSGRVSASRGTVRQAGFGDSDVPAPPTVHSRPAETAAKMTPAEILSKPTPIYTSEARSLHIQGEVLVEVVLEASGRLRVLRVVRGLGHGLDDEALREAEQIRFKPALRDGQPADSTVVLHFVFQLA